MASVTHIVHRRRQRRKRRRNALAYRRFWFGLAGIIAFLLVIIPTGIVLGYMAIVYSRAMNTLPEDPQQTLYLDALAEPSQIFDSSGQTLLFAVQAPLAGEHTWIPIEEMPEHLISATVLWEDSNFLQATSFDPFHTFSQLLLNLDHGPLEKDTSITARLVRNVIDPTLDSENAPVDYAREVALIAEINRRYSPVEVLEWHLNTNYYGNGAYGIEAAAQTYLGVSARDLRLDEIALLVAIPTQPEINPIDNDTAARGRQRQVLRQLLGAGHIIQTEFEQATNVYTPVRADAGQIPLIAPEFSVFARQQAEKILRLRGLDGRQLLTQGGLRITTTLDLDLYIQAECMLRTHLGRMAQDATLVTAIDGTPCYGEAYLPMVDMASAGDSPPDTGAIVIIDAVSGEIRAMVGPGTNDDYQPGPTLHPFVYLAGLVNTDPNYTLAEMLLDVRRTFPGAADGLLYVPNNADGQFRGPVSLRDAMGMGLLPPAAEVANVLNINDVINDVVHPIGINGLRDGIYDLSLLERGGGVSVLDMTYAYSTLADSGMMSGLPLSEDLYERGFRNYDPVAILHIEDAEGNILWDYYDDEVTAKSRVLFLKDAAYLINDALADDLPKQMILGDNNLFEMSRKMAVVNGLTVNQTDNWTIGYSPQIVTGVRLGRVDGQAVSLSNWGIEGAAPVWRGVMEYLHDRDSIPANGWPRPESVVELAVCERSGMSLNNACPPRTELFLYAGQMPEVDTYWQLVEVNTQTNQLATANTPAANRNTHAYFIPPDDAMEWWQANNLPLPPTQHDTLSRPDIISNTVILQPANLDYIGGIVSIRGSIDTDEMDYYQLSYGQGMNPNEWIALTDAVDTVIPGTSLAEWDTSTLYGSYTLQLTVVMQDGTREAATNLVTVDNISPSVILTAGESGQVFSTDDSVIPLIATARDDIRIDRVDFYHNAQYIGTDEKHPYQYDHRIIRSGTERFTAVVFDAVGNSSEASIQVEVTISGQ